MQGKMTVDNGDRGVILSHSKRVYLMGLSRYGGSLLAK